MCVVEVAVQSKGRLAFVMAIFLQTVSVRVITSIVYNYGRSNVRIISLNIYFLPAFVCFACVKGSNIFFKICEFTDDHNGAPNT